MVRLPPANSIGSNGVVGVGQHGASKPQVLSGKIPSSGTGTSNGVLIGKEDIL